MSNKQSRKEVEADINRQAKRLKSIEVRGAVNRGRQGRARLSLARALTASASFTRSARATQTSHGKNHRKCSPRSGASPTGARPRPSRSGAWPDRATDTLPQRRALGAASPPRPARARAAADADHAPSPSPSPPQLRTLASLNLPHAVREVVDKDASDVLDEVRPPIRQGLSWPLGLLEADAVRARAAPPRKKIKKIQSPRPANNDDTHHQTKKTNRSRPSSTACPSRSSAATASPSTSPPAPRATSSTSPSSTASSCAAPSRAARLRRRRRAARPR